MIKKAVKHLSPKNIDSARRSAVQLRLSGYSLSETAKRTGLSVPTVIKAFKAFESGGWAAVKLAPRGRKARGNSVLSRDQQQRLAQRLLQPPESGLWHWEAVVAEIQKTFGFRVSARTVSRLLESWGLEIPALKRAVPKPPTTKPSTPKRQAPRRRARSRYDRWYRQCYQPLQLWAEANAAPIVLAHCQPTQRQPGSFMICLQTPLRRQLWLESSDWPTQDWLINVFERLLQTVNGPAAVCLSGLDLSRADQLRDWLQKKNTLLFLTTVPAETELQSTGTH